MTERVALVTGSSRGIGAAIARALGRDGHDVVVCFRQGEDAARAVARGITHAPGGARDGRIARCELADPSTLSRAVDETLAALGRIDVVVHNATLDFPIGPFAALSGEAVAARVAAEMRAFHALVAPCVAGMKARRFGRIVAVSSLMSRAPSAGFGAYAAAKAALDGATLALAHELGEGGITANVVAPGVVATRLTDHLSPAVRAHVESGTPARRLAQPEDIGDVVAFLASERARWINGQYLALDGGLGAPLPFDWRAITGAG